ncbi:MAG: hypothetical protein ACPGLY_14965, partial [Rubripirellula sp.]
GSSSWIIELDRRAGSSSWIVELGRRAGGVELEASNWAVELEASSWRRRAGGVELGRRTGGVDLGRLGGGFVYAFNATLIIGNLIEIGVCSRIFNTTSWKIGEPANVWPGFHCLERHIRDNQAIDWMG